MLRKFVLPALGLMILPAFASAQFEAGNFELTLSGAGAISKDTTRDGIGGTVEVGYFATKELELGVRQSLSHISGRGSKDVQTVTTTNGNFTENSQVIETRGEGWTGSTIGVVDYHFDLGRFQPFVGVFGGYQYTNLDRHTQGVFSGETSKIHDSSWIAGPEAGLKYFVNGTTFVFARAGYDYWFQDHNQSFFTVDLGVGFRF